MKSDAIVGALKEAAKHDVDVEEALDQLTELVEAAHSSGPNWKNIEMMLSEVPLGFADKKCVVGWDTCGSCGSSLKKCPCKGGPTEPKYIKFFRSGNPMDPNTSTGTTETRVPTRVTSPSSESSLPGSSRKAVPSGTDVESDPVDTENDTIPTKNCRECGQQTLVTEGEDNDDQSFSCYACQAEGSTQ